MKITSPFLINDDGRATILRIELDETQIFPDDPGQGTPAMVILYDNSGKRELDSGTFYCAAESGELSHNGTLLSGSQVGWLESKRGQVDAFIRANTAHKSRHAA